MCTSAFLRGKFALYLMTMPVLHDSVDEVLVSSL